MQSLFPSFDHFNKPKEPATDVCQNKHHGNPASVAAFERCRLGITDSRLAVYEVIAKRGARGATCKEVAAILDRPLHAISGRATDLKAAGLVRETSERRGNSTVLVAVEGGK